jgi:hypothetical protein
LADRLNHDKAFKFVEKETSKVIRGMIKVGKDSSRKQDMVEEERKRKMGFRMKNYTEDWNKLANIGVKSYPRIANRIRSGYQSNLDLNNLVVN